MSQSESNAKVPQLYTRAWFCEGRSTSNAV